MKFDVYRRARLAEFRALTNKLRVLEVLEDIHFCYKNDKEYGYSVPAGLSLQKEEAWSIRSVSGSGKSTLLTLLASLRRFQSGAIRYTFLGESPIVVTSENWSHTVSPRLWRRIGFAFQQPELIRALTVEDNLKLVLGGHSENMRRVLFGAQEWHTIRSSNVWQVSRGQMQRLGLIRAFGLNQNLVFVDEPTNNLDRRNRAEVVDFVKKYRKQRALILVSHDEEFIRCLGVDQCFSIDERRGDDGRIWRQLYVAADVDNSHGQP